jgi:hypothetical protein
MARKTVATMPQPVRKRGPRPLRAAWKKIRAPLAKSRFVKNVLAWMIAHAVRFIDRTNPRVAGSDDPTSPPEVAARLQASIPGARLEDSVGEHVRAEFEVALEEVSRYAEVAEVLEERAAAGPLQVGEGTRGHRPGKRPKQEDAAVAVELEKERRHLGGRPVHHGLPDLVPPVFLEEVPELARGHTGGDAGRGRGHGSSLGGEGGPTSGPAQGPGR